MADTIKVPLIKDPLPKWAVWGGLAGTGLLIIAYYRNRRHQAAGQPAGSAAGLASGGLLAGDTSGAYPWDGTYGNPSDPYSMDTATGRTYGDEGYLGGFGPGGAVGTGNAPGSGVPGPPFASNAAWSAYALQQLTQQANMDAGAVAEALGLYLNGRELDARQQDIVYAARGIAGDPPVRGPAGFPPALRARPGQGHKGGKVFARNPVSGLHAKAGADTIEISWDKAGHATGYQVSLANVTAHRTAHAPVTTVHTSYTFRGLAKGDTFRATVLAKPAEKGAKAAETEART